MTTGSLMKVEIIALGDNGSFESGRFTQGLLYCPVGKAYVANVKKNLY